MSRIAHSPPVLPATKMGRRIACYMAKQQPVLRRAYYRRMEPSSFELFGSLPICYFPTRILDAFIDSNQHEPWEDMVEREIRGAIGQFKRLRGDLLMKKMFFPEEIAELQAQHSQATRDSHIARRLTWEQWALFKLAGIIF